MGNDITYAIILLAVSPALICLSHARCSGSCSISGGSSYDFLGDPSINPSLDTFDDFVRDNIGKASISTQSILPETQTANSSLNQTNIGDISLNGTKTFNVTENKGARLSNSTSVKLGSDAQDVRQSTLASMIFNNML